jgi:PST family polysaccharide transporter
VRSHLRQTAILGSGSLITIVVGVVTAKVYAILLGPSGVGTLGLLQALIAFVTPIAGAGVASVLVQELAYSLARGERADADAARRAAWRLVAALGGVAAVGLILAREPIARLVLGPAADPAAIVAVALAVVAVLTTSLGVSILNGYRRVANLARAAAASSLASGAVSVLVIVIGGSTLIPLAILLGTTAAAGVTLLFVLRTTPSPGRTPAANVTGAARRLLGLGIPIAIGTVISGTVQLAVPVVVLYLLGADAVGHYRAATAISVGYLGFLVVAMAQDYYPRLSAAADDPPGLARIAYQQQRLIVAVAIPIIMVTLATVPLIIPVLYSASFAPAAGILQTQLIGDLLKLPSWTFAFILIVLAYLVTYLIYYPLTFVVVRRSAPLVIDKAVQGPILLAFLLSLLVVALPLIGQESVRLPAAILAALASVGIAARLLGRELGLRVRSLRWWGP